MRKLLVFAIILLSGCATEISTLGRYDVRVPQNKATLAIEKNIKWLRKDPFESESVQKTWQKYFARSSSETADFVLTEINQTDCGCPWDAVTILTAAIVPTWGTAKCTYSYSLTRRETGKIVMLSDIQGKSRIITGILTIPALFFPDVTVMIPNDYYLTSGSAMAAAIEEAAALVYDKNSKIYQTATQKKWGAPAAETATETSEPVQQSAPEDMDAAW